MALACSIKFNASPYAVYLPGQTVAGHIELHLSQATIFKDIKLHIKGIAEVSWYESIFVDGNPVLIPYHGRHQYMHHTKSVVAVPDASTVEFPAGLHRYEFSYALPSNLPTSLETEQGYVRYTAKVVLERPQGQNRSFKVGFTVLRHVNLNHERDMSIPAKTEKNKTYCCGPCRSDPLNISAQLPISGYVPGQTIAVKINIENQTKKGIKKISTKLVQVISYISQTPYCEVSDKTTIVAEVRCQGSEARANISEEQYLLIPIVPPSSKSCPVLTVNYFVEVEVKVSGPNINPRVRIPITLGTVPLCASAIPAFDEAATVIMHEPRATTSSLEAYYELPPPSYEEAIDAMRINILDDGEASETTSDDYRPRYVVYRFGSTHKCD
ncbi:arrestin domain-containing protein 3-like isoform X2 [Wyeomyia smithii]|uniref:arrestin domain-containing protein 3-like isoform X2 n=1 Tax=Wyeomyia smithii TaxID=174621 RepID=UPI002467AD46|nr:arrestin domain-containing protein 3-like isoform X2 [Wyeomyia smithii]